MSVDTLQKFRKLFAILAATVAVVLLIVSAFVLHTLHQSRLRYYTNAEETSKNLAISLENFLHSHFQEADLTLRRAAAEFHALHQQRRFDDAAFSAYLRSLKDRVPQARSIRGTQRDGLVIYGEDIDLAKPQPLAIREFFQRVKSERKLVFGIPVKSRITDEWVLPMIYPLTLPDGAFGGSAYVNLTNSRITELFSSIHTGPHGVITLIDNQRRVLHRFPESKDVVIGSPASLSAKTAAILAENRRRATYSAVNARDNIERVLSVERVGDYPVYVLVGLSSDDFLAPWREEARNDAIFLAILFLLAATLLLGVRYSLRRQYQALDQLLQKDRALQGSLARLTQSESRWRSLTEGLPQMVWTITPQRRFDFLSHHWQHYTGIPVDSLLVDGAWFDLLHPDDRAAVDAAWERARQNGGVFRCDCRLRRHDGAWRVFDHHALPQKNAEGELLCWVGSSTDMTETRAAHAQLLLAKDLALAAGRAKSDFVANMSHEIRTPMNAVLGMLQLLRQTALDVRQRDYAVKAEMAARALLGLLNDILDFSKVEAGKLTLDMHPFSVDKLLRELSLIMSANVGGKDVEILFQIDRDLPQWVIGDALRLQQILLNLTGNAIKFTEHGEIMLSVNVLREQESALTVAFAVRDTGIGISSAQQEHVFDGFSQAEASTARRYGGSGLGLAISQRLVSLMGGTLRVDSTPEVGSVFAFSVDFQRVQAQVAVTLDPARLQQLDCLVVDDNPSARQIIGEMAASFGWRVETAHNGLDALAAVTRRGARQPYDVIFIDWRMPSLDGWETSRQIRQLQPAGKTPLIIMVTAHERELLAQQQAQHGSVLDGVLVKPVTASMLFDAVADATVADATVADATVADATVASTTPTGTGPGPARPGHAPLLPAPSLLRLTGLRLLLVEDNPTNQQVARELLGFEGAQVDVAACGQAAIEAVEHGAVLPDLILMDIQMPDMDGYTATGVILALLGLRAPPIVAMTANAMAADRGAALRAGMVDHVGKPFDLDQLIDVILLHARSGALAAAGTPGADAPASNAPGAGSPAAGSPAAGSPAAGSPAAPPSPPLAEALALAPSLDHAAALKRLGGLAPIYAIALRSFIDEAGTLAAQLRAAQAEQRIDAVKAPLHILKGLAGTVGAGQLSQLAGQAEQAAHADPGACWHAVAAVLAATPDAVAAVETLLRQLDAGAPAVART